MDVITLAQDRKRAAQRARKNNQPDHAVALLDEAISALLSEMDHLSDEARLGEAGRKLAEALADTYGTKGGVLRTAKRYDESVRAYDRGYDYESDPAYRITNSYNLTQRLVARIFAVPERLSEVTWKDDRTAYPDSFQGAEQEVSRQLVGARVNDPWAMADRALLVLLLLGDLLEEQQAWRRIVRSEPPAYVFSSTLAAIDDLRNRINEALQASMSPRVADIRTRLDWAATFLQSASA